MRGYEEKLERLVSWARGIPAPPYRIEAEITDLCNSRCIFCWQRSSPRAIDVDVSRELTREQWLDLVRRTAAMGAREWHLCGGGEPLMRPDVSVDAMYLVKELGMRGELTTNGTLFKPDVIEKLVRLGWDQVEISMEAPDQEVNNYLRGIDYSFQNTTEAMRQFKFWKEKLGRDRPRVLIAGVLTTMNYRLLPEMMRFTHETGCEKLSMNPIVISKPPYEPARALKLNAEQLAELPEICREAKRIADALGLETNIDDFIDTRYVGGTNKLDEVIKEDAHHAAASGFCAAHCYLPWQVMAIRPYGLVGPCVLFNDDESDSLDDYTIEEIWEGDYFNRIRRDIAAQDLPDYCARCCPPFVIEGKNIQKALLEQEKRGAFSVPGSLAHRGRSLLGRLKCMLRRRAGVE
ncbi:radical SAM protein [bacterium]|nr:radical SAM protein [candidate division CSSED10-310 bacterium]